ncbi:SAM-dependent methyltransferase [Thioclava atlantica]|nr:cyclopropane-fatty-acyl-phospholipid synthase family protein [Thioclava atlantica]
MPFLTNRIRHEFLETCEKIQHGTLHLRLPGGETRYFGRGAPHAEMEIRDWQAVVMMAARGDVGLGEAYIAGFWDTPSIEALLSLALKNLEIVDGYAYAGFWSNLKFRIVDRLLRANSLRGASRNIRSHYDVGNEFYQIWLDEGMSYSSGLFAPGDDDLHRAQNRKLDRILDNLGTGERVLEIGCGWGHFAERAADQGRQVTGITISPSQKGYADARLDGRAEIRLQDYRRTPGTFDHIVSIEMIEAVGERYWPTYFGTLKDRLSEGGTAMIQAITVSDSYFPTYRETSDFIRQYTFPGGMLLSDGVIRDQAERAGLAVRESFGFGQDYAETCRQWAARLKERSARAAKMGYGPEFLRGWLYYLEACAAAFAVGHTDVVQVQLAHARA